MENGYIYDVTALRSMLATIIQQYATPEQYAWLEGKAAIHPTDATQLAITLTAIPRKTNKTTLQINKEQLEHISYILPGFTINGWTLSRLCRIWWLMQVTAEKENYHATIESLFTNAEMNELADMYAAMPVLAYAATWEQRCTEGIRSNIGIVLEAIMYENPYPAIYLAEAAWNQLVLKAFFTDKDINRITGLDERANARLASTLIDYAHERMAARRTVHPQLWRLVARFIDETNFTDIQNLFASDNVTDRNAAVLACSDSSFPPAKDLLETVPHLKNEIIERKLTWQNLN